MTNRVTDEQKVEMARLRGLGLSYEEISTSVGRNISTVYYACNPEGNSARKAYRKTPEYKAKEKAYRKTPEYKAYQKTYQKTYRQTPEYKANKKAYSQTPEAKANAKAYREKPESKARIKAYHKDYRQKQEVKERYIAYTAENYKQVMVKLNLEKDAAIIAYLDVQDNRTETIRRAILAQMAKEKRNSERF